MRNLGIVVVLLIASAAIQVADAGVARRQYCEDRYQEVFLAARQAVHDVGARIVHSDDGSGSIVGRMEADIYSHVIEISVWINRDRSHQGGPGTMEPIWVQVKAKIKKVKDPDPHQLEVLEGIENEIFNLIRRRADCGPPS